MVSWSGRGGSGTNEGVTEPSKSLTIGVVNYKNLNLKKSELKKISELHIFVIGVGYYVNCVSILII